MESIKEIQKSNRDLKQRNIGVRGSVPKKLPSHSNKELELIETQPNFEVRSIKNYLHNKTHFKAATSVFL